MGNKSTTSNFKKRKQEKGSAPNAESQLVAGGEGHHIAGGEHPALTTNQGVSLSDNQNSLRANPRSPTLLEDFILREKVTHFDHERIPERIVHARGTGVHGFFELTASLKQYTIARILTEVGEKAPVFTRLSTVAGGTGSVDTPRDYTRVRRQVLHQGGQLGLGRQPTFRFSSSRTPLNSPTSAMPSRWNPTAAFPQSASAHDTFWDFISLTPESMHTVMWIMSDRTLPRPLRMNEGFGVHSLRLINDAGESTFVKFDWRPKLGLQSTIWDEAVKISGADQDFHHRDLFEPIEAGNFPEWNSRFKFHAGRGRQIPV